MINLRKCIRKIFANKVKNNFPTNDVFHELKLLKGEIMELEADLHNNADVEPTGKEIADCMIFLLAIARIKGVDIEKAVKDKIAYNSKRVYKPETFRIAST